LRHCEERRDEAIAHPGVGALSGLLRFSRNDGWWGSGNDRGGNAADVVDARLTW
jgi:hypothetical protein